MDTLYILFTSSTIISQKEKCSSVKFCLISREYCATSVVLLSLRCTVKRHTFYYGRECYSPTSAEEPHFTGVPASSKPPAFPSSAKGKATKIAVQKWAAEAYKEGVLPKDRQQGPSRALTTAAPARGRAGSRRRRSLAPHTPARRCAPPAPRRGRAAGGSPSLTPAEERGEDVLPARGTRGAAAANGARCPGPRRRGHTRCDGGRVGGRGVREQRRRHAPLPRPRPALTCR